MPKSVIGLPGVGSVAGLPTSGYVETSSSVGS